MSSTSLETPAWLMTGVATTNATPGTLRLDRGRLSFRATGAEAAAFDIALDDVANVAFPFYNLGSVVRFDAGGTRYRLAFLASEPTVQVVRRPPERRAPGAPLGQAVEGRAHARRLIAAGKGGKAPRFSGYVACRP